MMGAHGLVAEKKGRGGTGARTPRKKRPDGPETHIGSALRTAYEETVRESVPDEFLDLLGKLN